MNDKRHDAVAGTQGKSPTPAPTEEYLPGSDSSNRRRELAIKLERSDSALPYLTGEIRDLIYLRLREVALLVTIGWLFVLLLCISGVDSLFNVSRLGITCISAISIVVAVFVACWISLFARRSFQLAWLRAYEAVFMCGAVICASCLRYSSMSSALNEVPIDNYMVLYGSAFSNIVWMAVLVIYGIFAPNTWRRLLIVTFATVLVLASVEIVVWWHHIVDHSALFVSDILVTTMSIFLGAGTGLYGSFKLESAREAAINARKQLKELGKYQLKELIGSGGMGEVYLAEHILLRRPCAVKLIAPANADDEKQIARFEREVKATAALTHPNTVEIYDYGRTEDGTFYYAMEYLSGLDLNELVERFGALPPARAIHLLQQACGALNEAHQRGMVHRDVKPANMIVCMRGGIHDTLKLLDFGLARVIADESDTGRLTQDGAITGTPEFMSPEQAESQDEIDSRSDIYSLGAVAYFLLAGQPPFQRKSAAQYIIAHAREAAQPIGDIRKDLPQALQFAIMKCLEKDRKDRFQSVEELQSALSNCIGEAGRWSASDAKDWWHQHASVDLVQQS